jgi:hypothetical protein
MTDLGATAPADQADGLLAGAVLELRGIHAESLVQRADITGHGSVPGAQQHQG